MPPCGAAMASQGPLECPFLMPLMVSHPTSPHLQEGRNMIPPVSPHNHSLHLPLMSQEDDELNKIRNISLGVD